MLRLFRLELWLLGIFLVVFFSVVVGIVYRTYHYLRGRRNLERGISCIQCKRIAFPVGRNTNRYRCWNCGCRFEGPEHF
jgi:hypothetical protein